MSCNRVATLPLPALVGRDVAIRAALLLAVEPRLQGLVIAAPAGSGKSALARGFAALLAEGTPFVEAPASVDDEALLGGVDLEATVRLGRRVARPGLLARAHGGVLYVDGLNLLSDTAANHLLDSIETGAVRVERDGVSHRHATRFRWLATYDPAEGSPRAHLVDRAGLIVHAGGAATDAQRQLVIRHNLIPCAVDWEDEVSLLRQIVTGARALLPAVMIADRDIEQLAMAANACGVQGNRAERFATLAARAAAALALRDRVEDDDLREAILLTILPRATRAPKPTTEAQPPPPPPTSSPEASDGDSDAVTTVSPIEQVFEVAETTVPFLLADLPFARTRRGKTGSRGETEGNRGRHVHSRAGDPRRHRIDIVATLRAAAPWQKLRSGHDGDARRPVRLRADDLRVKQYRSKAGTLFCLMVDASGSMALNRMRQAKGAVHALLRQAYVHRDRVALIAFRGAAAEVLMPPSQSVELARRALDVLPTGGGTPLAAALLAGLTVAKTARSRGIFQTVFVLLTDGRANVGVHGSDGDISREVERLSHAVAAQGIASVVVDTQRAYLSRGEAKRLAEWLNGQYVYLPNADGSAIARFAQASR